LRKIFHMDRTVGRAVKPLDGERLAFDLADSGALSSRSASSTGFAGNAHNARNGLSGVFRAAGLRYACGRLRLRPVSGSVREQ
jgi:hypothetical protein